MTARRSRMIRRWGGEYEITIERGKWSGSWFASSVQAPGLEGVGSTPIEAKRKLVVAIKKRTGRLRIAVPAIIYV
jgi:hypothetical protein